MNADLHIHTHNSDGKDSLREILSQIAKETDQKKPVFLGVTDHHFLTLSQPLRFKHITVIPGIECSTVFNQHSCHLTAYSSNPRVTTKLRELFEHINKGYGQRAKKIHEQIADRGISLGFLRDIRDPSLPGPAYTFDFATKLKEHYGMESEEEAIAWSRANNNLLWVPEKNFLPPTQHVIDMLHKSNFVVFLAHPGTSFLQNQQGQNVFDSLIASLKDAGLNGIEVFYPKHSDVQTHYFLRYAKRFDLLTSGGSDYHGEGRGVPTPLLILPKQHFNPIRKALRI